MPAGPDELLTAIVQSADDAILAKRFDGTIIFWNPAAERLYGYSAAEAIGRPISMIVPDDRRDELAHIMQSVASGRRVEHLETVRVTKDGRLVDVSVTVSPVLDGGVPVAASAIARDITAVRAEQRRNRRRAIALHDDVLQSVTAAKFAIELGQTAAAFAALDRALAGARSVIDELLDGGTLDAAELRVPS